jgi:hypothetical protein
MTIPGLFTFASQRPVLLPASSLGGNDDSANLADMISAGVRSVQFVDSQTYAWKSPLVLPLHTPLRMHGAPGSGIVTNVTGGTLGTGLFAFLFDGFTAATDTGATISVNANVGDTSVTLSSTAGLSVGSPIIFVAQAPNPRAVQSAYVRALPGGNVVLLGTAEGTPISLCWAFQSGTVVLLSPGFPRDIVFDGNGMTLTDTSGGGFMEALCGWNLVWRRLRMVCSQLSLWGSFFDIGCRGCLYDQVEVQWLGGAAFSGIGLAYTVATHVLRCRGSGAWPTSAIQAGGARNFTIADCLVERGVAGVQLDGEGGPPGANDTMGCRWGEVRNVTAIGHSYAGFVFQDGGSDVAVIDCTSLDAPVGLRVQAGGTTTYPDHIRVIGGKYQGSAAGVHISGGADFELRSVDLSGSAAGVVCDGAAPTSRILLDGVTADDCTGNAYMFQGPNVSGVEMRRCTGKRAGTGGVMFSCVDLTIRGIDLTDAAISIAGGAQLNSVTTAATVVLEDAVLGFSGDPPHNVYGISEVKGGDWTLQRVRFALPTSPSHTLVCFGATSATYRMRDVRVVSSAVTGPGGGASYGFLTTGGNLLDLGGCDFSAAGTPYSLAAGTNTNWGSVTFNGATEVAVNNVASPGPQASLSFSMTTPGGTSGSPFQSTPLSGGSFNVRSTSAADTSVRRWALR